MILISQEKQNTKTIKAHSQLKVRVEIEHCQRIIIISLQLNIKRIISIKNRKFNKKLERFFGKDCAEIKANLERGTAI